MVTEHKSIACSSGHKSLLFRSEIKSRVKDCGAGDETRTRDNLLGRQGLYQLSYSRKTVSILAPHPPPVKEECLA